MTPSVADLSLYTENINDVLACRIGTYANDTIAMGPEEFKKDSRMTERNFESKMREYDDVKVHRSRDTEKMNRYVMHQRDYSQKLRELEKEDDFNSFRSLILCVC